MVPADPNPLIPNSNAGIAYLALTDHDGQNVTRMRALNRIATYPILDGKSTWVAAINTIYSTSTAS